MKIHHIIYKNGVVCSMFRLLFVCIFYAYFAVYIDLLTESQTLGFSVTKTYFTSSSKDRNPWFLLLLMQD